MINLATTAMVAEDTKSTDDKPQKFNKAVNHPSVNEIWPHEEATRMEEDA